MNGFKGVYCCPLKEGKTTKWRIENSWGEDGGEKGIVKLSLIGKLNFFTRMFFLEKMISGIGQ